MTDLQILFSAVDQLSPEELIRLRQYVDQKAQTLIYSLSEDQIDALDAAFRPVREAAETMPDEAIDAAISEALSEVRHERKTKNRR